ncbi:MAG TPA: 3-deoxy-D-manno-octulosonate 8-phosphate phosphatase [Bacteroidia bacterium]|nr:3-deoxy-D-manno-octulosonate 8-phosphate phosphatase [Bacteroidia bacterium]
MQKNFKQILPKITTIILDMDGVLTNGTVTPMADGTQVRTMNIKDGYAIDLAIKKGLNVTIISGGKSEEVKVRLQKLGVKNIFMQARNKMEVFSDFIHDFEINPETILYMGDDMPDYEVMKNVAAPTCPADAASEIQSISIYISNKKGGYGCVRDVIEQVLKAQDKWE